VFLEYVIADKIQNAQLQALVKYLIFNNILG